MEGGAQQVQGILERMKELASQAASDSVDNQARAQLNSEFDELAAEVDRIVSTTKFQGQSLLDGTYGSATTTVNSFDTTVANYLGDVAGVTVGVSSESIFNQLAAGNITATVTQNNGTITGETVGVVAGLDGTVSISGQPAFNTLDEGVYSVSKGGSTITLFDANNVAIDSVDVTANTGGGDVVFALAGITLTGDGATDINGAADGALGNITIDQSFAVQLAQGAATQSLTLSANGSTQALNFTSFGVRVRVEASANDVDFSIGANNTLTVQHSTVSQAQFMVSASGDYTSNDLVLLDSVNLTAAQMGVDTGSIDLTTGANAQAALTNIDDAINTLSDTFAAIGGAQNRMEFAFANAQSMVENLSAAESVIRDVDMAEEITAMTKYQILQQAGTAMLAQANSAPQQILSLLR
jgi:flagellin